MKKMNSTYEYEYKKLLQKILIDGTKSEARDGNTRIVLFGKSLKHDNKSELFPMLTSKKMFFKNIKHELSWILRGYTNTEYLKKHNVNIWDLWADEEGNIGDTYGKQLRNFNGTDQLIQRLKELETNTNSSQLVISLWNPNDIEKGNLRPCYHAFQFVPINNILHIQVSQRSADAFIGLPYDIAVFSLLLRIVANVYGFTPGVVNINIGNLHIYEEHIEPVTDYLRRSTFDLPRLTFRKKLTSVVDFENPNVDLNRYECHDFIKAKIIK